MAPRLGLEPRIYSLEGCCLIHSAIGAKPCLLVYKPLEIIVNLKDNQQYLCVDANYNRA